MLRSLQTLQHQQGVKWKIVTANAGEVMAFAAKFIRAEFPFWTESEGKVIRDSS